ncbi:MAG: DUF4410 domain-containing protein [Steroidobacteraceae bacterium]
MTSSITSLRAIVISTLMALLAVALGGCGSSRYTMVDPPKQEVSSFKVLEIGTFTSALADQDSRDLAQRFADQLHAAVMKDREKNPGKSIFDEVVRATDRTDKVLRLDGTVVSFEKGSRAKRYFIGFGAGKAFCTIQAVFTDKATAQQVLKANFDGEFSMSFFGGSADEAVDSVVKAFIDYFRDYFEKGGPAN